MPRRRAPESSRSAPLVPRVKVWLESEGRYAFGFGLSEILQAVERAGSIKQAAADLGKSYRYIWGRIKAAEKVIGQVLVETHVGGKGTQRNFLTSSARDLVKQFLALRSHLTHVAEQAFSQHMDRTASSRPAGR